MESTHYWLNDQPAAPLVLEPARDGAPIDLTPYTGGVGIVTWADGTTAAATVTLQEDAVSVQLPQLTHPGLAWLYVTLTGAGGVQNRLEAVPLVVQVDDGWLSLPAARSLWNDAPSDDLLLYLLLIASRDDCLAYAPQLPAGARPPETWRLYQLMHARNKLNASRVDPSGGGSGGTDFVLQPFPLDWAIKQGLRPNRGPRGVL